MYLLVSMEFLSTYGSIPIPILQMQDSSLVSSVLRTV